jgi:Zn-dependent protease/CBS domain-containing protein
MAGTTNTETASEIAPLRRGGLSLFHIAGIEIRLDYSWLIIFALILVSLSGGYFPRALPDQSTAGYWIAGLVGTLLFFASILIHELSHALVARLSGIPVPAITLFLFGGVSQMKEEASKPGTEFRIAVVGPLTSFALAALFWGVGRVLPTDTQTLTTSVVHYMAFINVALGVFNLLPGFPLDGGRVLRAALWWRTGSLRRATRIAADAGKGLAVGVIILGGLQILLTGALVGGLWLVFIGLFLRGLAEAGYQNLVLTQALEDETVANVATTDVVTVSPALSIRELVDDYLLPHGYRAFPVVEGGAVRGLISVDELKNLPAEKRGSVTVKERMIPLKDEIRVEPDLALIEAMKRLSRAPGGRLLVMRGDELVGLLTKSALARFVEIRHALEET